MVLNGTNNEKQTYISNTSDAGSFDTKWSTATSRKDNCFGASTKAYSIPSLTTFKMSDLCLFRAAPINVPES